MADTVEVNVVKDTLNRYEVVLTNVSDGTGESGVTKVDISTLTGPIVGVAPTRLDVERIQATVNGFETVRLYWDHTTDKNIAVLTPGQSDFKFKRYYKDPGTTGEGTGDVLLTTTGNAGKGYTIRIRFRKRA